MLGVVTCGDQPLSQNQSKPETNPAVPDATKAEPTSAPDAAPDTTEVEPTSAPDAESTTMPEEAPAPKPALTFEEQREYNNRLQVEQAKDPTLYETYLAKTAEIDPNVQLFAARRKGRSHEKSGKACQDYCMAQTVGSCIVLTDADGVSSCARSDVGSRLACEAVNEMVAQAQQRAKTEEELVATLGGIAFRRKVVNWWLSAVMRHNAENRDSVITSDEDVIYQYGTTLMFVVLTPTHYVAGCLGDGQILFFNQENAVKVRVHAVKESSRVRALVAPTCYLTDFAMATLPRAQFRSVLLTTDGVYDVLGKGRTLHRYATQAQARFLANDAPLQPFCLTEPGESMMDLFAKHTQDDCSVVLAVDAAPVAPISEAYAQAVSQYADAFLLTHLEQGVGCYLAKKGDALSTVVVTENGAEKRQLPKLTSATFVHSAKSYRDDALQCSVYSDAPGVSLEIMKTGGLFYEKKGLDPVANAAVLKVYKKLSACQNELMAAGYTFAAQGRFLTFFDEKKEQLFLYPEAIEPLSQRPAQSFSFWGYFDALLGVLACNGVQRPLFHGGYFARGSAIANLPVSPYAVFCRVEQAKQELLLRNISATKWYQNIDGEETPIDHISLAAMASFVAHDEASGAVFNYHYYPKELL